MKLRSILWPAAIFVAACSPPLAFAQTVATCTRAGAQVTIKTQGRDTACVLSSGAVKYTVTVTAPAASPAPTPAPTPTPQPAPTPTPAPTPAPSGSACANEPAGFMRFEDQAWSAVLPAKWIDDARNWTSRGSLVQDGTAPLSPPTVVAGKFPGGMPGGVGPFYIWRPFANGEQFSKLYLCVVIKTSADFDNTSNGRNAGTKVFWPAGDQQQGTATYVTLNAGGMDLGVNTQGPSAVREMYANQGSAATALARLVNSRGQWLVWEFVFGANSASGAKDGTLDIWINGTRTHHYTDVVWDMASARKWLSLAWNPTYGGGTFPVPHDQFEYIDHLRMSGGNK